MNEDWNSGGYDGGFLSDGKNKNRYKNRTKIPKFRSITSKSSRRRRRSSQTEHDAETLILMWAVISFLVSAVFHVEWVFISFYGIFLLYTLVTKDIAPIRYVSSIIFGMGILFFIAITLVVVLGYIGGTDMLQDLIIRKAYTYIIGTPLISWLVVRGLENWVNGPIKKGF